MDETNGNVPAAFGRGCSSCVLTAAGWLESGHLPRIGRWTAGEFGIAVEDVGDLVQEIGLKLARLDPGRLLNAAYLFRAAENAAIDLLRRRRRESLRRGRLPDRERAAQTPICELRSLMKARASRLPGMSRRVYGLRIEAGCSERETAAQLGLSRGEVRHLDDFCRRFLTRGPEPVRAGGMPPRPRSLRA
jgi:RNA polymerase sigma factor (sigma-70 family)